MISPSWNKSISFGSFEGYKYLRFYNGVICVYGRTLWKKFTGCLSDVALRRIQGKLMALEGFSEHSDHARHAVWTPSSTVLTVCDRKQLTSQTQYVSRHRVSRQPPSVLCHEATDAGEGEWDQEPGHTGEWAIAVLSSFVQWFETPCEAVSGFATRDASWVFSETPPLVRAARLAL